MDSFFRSNPGMSSRIAHHLDFPRTMRPAELLQPSPISSSSGRTTVYALPRCARSFRGVSGTARIPHSRTSPTHAACAKRARPCPTAPGEADCLPTRIGGFTAEELTTIACSDIRASRGFQAAASQSQS